MFREGLDEGMMAKGLRRARSGGMWPSSLVLDPCLHCLPAHTEKGDQDSITFHFCFILAHIPLVKTPESAWELFLEARPAAALSSGSPAACPLVSYPWGHRLPLPFSTICPPSLLSAREAPPGRATASGGSEGDPGATGGFQEG